MVVMWPVVVAVSILAAGVGLVWLGVRGRRVDDHPVCRKCGFDLVGLPEGSVVCSECGADVKKRGAVRVGHRRKLKWLVGAGAGLVVMCVGFLGVVGWVVGRGADVNEYKPVWWLMREASGGDAKVRDPALGELLRRVKDGTLSEGQLAKVVDRALEIQGDMSKAWVTGWGDMVELLRAQGELPEEKWRQYVKQGPVILLEVRPRVRIGAPLPVRVGHAARVGRMGVSFIKHRDLGMEISGQAYSEYWCRGLSISALFPRPDVSQYTIPATEAVVAKLKEGPQTGKLKKDLWVYLTAPTDFVDGKVKPIGTWRVELERKWELVGGETVKLVKNEEVRWAVEKAVTVKVRRGGGDRVSVWVLIQSVPVGVAFDVFVREGQKEWKVGRIACGAFSGRTDRGLDEKAAGLGDWCEVVLRPSKEAAEETVDVTEIWDGEVVIKEVVVERPTTRAAPATR